MDEFAHRPHAWDRSHMDMAVDQATIDRSLNRERPDDKHNETHGHRYFPAKSTTIGLSSCAAASPAFGRLSTLVIDTTWPFSSTTSCNPSSSRDASGSMTVAFNKIRLGTVDGIHGFSASFGNLWTHRQLPITAKLKDCPMLSEFVARVAVRELRESNTTHRLSRVRSGDPGNCDMSGWMLFSSADELESRS